MALEIERPTVIRRTVSFAQAIFDRQTAVEGVTAKYCETEAAIKQCLAAHAIPVCIDEKGEWIDKLKPQAVVDAILAKRNLGTKRDMAPITIGLGPGFTAGKDVDAVIETCRGHNLGRVIYQGSAAPNTGIPGNIDGFTHERVIHAPETGKIRQIRDIGDSVEKNEPIAAINNCFIRATISGVLRGIIADKMQVKEGMKIADIDPRGKAAYCYSISDKARNISGGVLEALLHLTVKKQNDLS